MLNLDRTRKMKARNRCRIQTINNAYSRLLYSVMLVAVQRADCSCTDACAQRAYAFGSHRASQPQGFCNFFPIFSTRCSATFRIGSTALRWRSRCWCFCSASCASGAKTPAANSNLIFFFLRSLFFFGLVGSSVWIIGQMAATGREIAEGNEMQR